MSRYLAGAVCVTAILMTLPVTVLGQEPLRAQAEVAGGVLTFPDDGAVNERFIGAAMRLYVTPRISVGPELTLVSGVGHSHVMATGNVTVDLRDGRSRVVPFVVAGAGVFQTRDQFPGRVYISYDPSFTAGGGLRAALSRRWTAGGEVRLGWELHTRLNGFVGIRLFGA